MLNYTSKIQHFLNLHRKHTKYIVVLLLLSAFVASFVCSALTEPAVSMTDPIQMGQNVTLLADGDQSDGLPIISGHYENSQFKDYIKWDTQTSTDGRLLGSAHNFALFAFEEINIKTPCYGNLASKKLNVNANFGLENIASAGGQSITIATESFLHGGGAQSKNTVLLVPQNVNFYNEQGNPVTINPIPKVQIKQPDGTTGHFEKGTIDVYAYHVTSDFIDFTAEKNNFITLQKWLVEQGGKNENSIINLGDTNIIRDPTNNDQFREIKIDNKGVNYLNIDYKNLPTDSKVLNLYLAEDAAVIINVDCKDVTENIKTSFQFREYQNGDEIGNNSEAYLKGTNVLWNFYNSNDTNYQFDKEIHMGNSASGIILAPSSNVYLNSQHTGGVVANKIETSATFTKAMFMTSMESFASGSIAVMAKKNWQNNEIPDGASVQVELYRSKTPNVDITNLPDGEKVGDTLTLNAGNYWNATWFDLDQSYYYYVKELPVSANGKFYEAAYTNNGRNTTGTVDIENSIMEIESGGDNEGGETETPTQTIDITVKIETNPDNLFDNSGTTNPGKNVNIYRSTIPNLTIDQLPTGDHINIQDGNYIDSSKFQNIEFIIGHTEDDKRKSIYITKEMGWQHTFEDQPMFDSNKNPYYYYIIETWHQTNSAVGYENVYLGNGAYLKDSTITMYSIKTIDINVVKNWQNTNDSNPNSVKFEIWRSYTSQQSIPSDAQWVSTNELSSSNSWSAKVENVPISDINNNTYYYYIKETEIENNSSKLNEYDISYSTNDNVYPIYSDKANDANDRHSITESNITITNKKKAADKISITVKKDMRGKDNDYWNNQKFGFNLYKGTDIKNISEHVGWYELTKSNNWEITISDLDKYNNNQPYYYKVVETNTPSTFNATYSTEALNAGSVSGNGTIWIYNNPKKVSLNIQKFWEPIDIVNKIEYVKIKVYQVKSTDYQMAQTLLLNNSLTFNSYINMLNGSSNPTINGNTATYTGLSFAPVTASDYNHEIRIDLSQFAGETLSKLKIEFNAPPKGTVMVGYDSKPNHQVIVPNINQIQLWSPEQTTWCDLHISNISNGTELIITSIEAVEYKISSFELIFANVITTGTTTQPAVTTTTKVTTTTTTTTTTTQSGSTATWGNTNYTDQTDTYSAHRYNFVYDLSSHKGKKITKLEFKFSQDVTFNSNGSTYYIIAAEKQNLTGQNTSKMLLKVENDFASNIAGCTYNNNTLTYIVANDSGNYPSGLREIQDNDYLVFTAGNSQPNFSIQQLTITFADSNNQNQNQITFPGYWWNGEKTELNFNSLSSANDTNGQYSPNKNNYVYQLPDDAKGKTITHIEIGLNNFDINGKTYYLACDDLTGLKNIDSATRMLIKTLSSGTVYDSNQGLSFSNNVLNYVVANDTAYLSGLRSVGEDDYLVIAIDNNTSSSFSINYLKITFASDEDEPPISSKIEHIIEEYINNTSDNPQQFSGEYYIPSGFADKVVVSVESAFYNYNDLGSESFDMYVQGNKNNNWYWLKDEGINNWQDDYQFTSYENSTEENRTNIGAINIKTKYTQNLDYVLVKFTDESYIKIINKNFYSRNNGSLATGSTTAAPQQTTIITYTTAITIPTATVDGNGVMIESNDNSVFITLDSSDELRKFKEKKIDRVEGTFYNHDKFGAYSDSVWQYLFNMWISGTTDTGGISTDGGEEKWSGDTLIKDFAESKHQTITTIGFRTAYPQNFEKIVVYFDDGSWIEVRNSNFNENNVATGTTTTTTTTTTPSNGFITEITLTETNGEWKTTLNDLPMVAPDGTPYYYIIVEVEIGYTDGTVLSGIDNITKKFDVTKNKEYLELSDKDGAENLLSITNSLKLTNVNMPSTGGIGTHPYRNAGILMMICSGGIYISLRALRKKQN